jgi:hypothetical protein
MCYHSLTLDVLLLACVRLSPSLVDASPKGLPPKPSGSSRLVSMGNTPARGEMAEGSQQSGGETCRQCGDSTLSALENPCTQPAQPMWTSPPAAMTHPNSGAQAQARTFQFIPSLLGHGTKMCCNGNYVHVDGRAPMQPLPLIAVPARNTHPYSLVSLVMQFFALWHSSNTTR